MYKIASGPTFFTTGMRWIHGSYVLWYSCVVANGQHGTGPENADTALETSLDDFGPSAEKYTYIKSGPFLTRKSGQNMDLNK
jgi:hypothetical protein